MVMLIGLFSISSFAQDNKPVDNKAKIKQNRAKSVKKKEKATTKDIAGKRLRTKNANSVAGRAIHSNPSPYANERRGKDRVAKPIGGQPLRIRSRSAESARNNVYPQRGPFVNSSSGNRETGRTGKSRYTRSGKLSTQRTSTSGGSVNPPRSRSRSAESSRSNAYPQKGRFVSRSPRQSERSAKSQTTRTGRLSTSARITKTYSSTPRSRSQSAETSRSRSKSFARGGRLSSSGGTTKNIRASAPRSGSTSAESARGKQFQQSGRYVNRSSKSTETVSTGNQYGRKTKLSAGPVPPGKKKTVTPRSASQPFVTRKKKDVYWGKFSKGEKAITTDISGNPLRRRNYRTPPNEIIQPKDPYEGRKRSSGDRAYSGTFKSGHVSSSKRTEKAWIGDVSGQPIRKRPSKQMEVAGKRMSSTDTPGKNQNLSGRVTGKRPVKGAGGSISASGKYRSNQPFKGGGGSISASGKYRSNQPFKGGGGSISASGKYRSNKPFNGRVGSSLSVSGQNRTYDFKPKGGGSVSGKLWNNNNQPISVRTPGKGGSALARYQDKINPKQPTKIFSQGGLNYYKGSGAERARKGNLSAIETSRNKDNRALPSIDYGSDKVARFQGNVKAKEPKKGGGSVSGKLWNNDGQPIEVRTPTGKQAADVGYSGKTKLPFFKRAYVRNPNAAELAMKKEKPQSTMYMADDLQVMVKAKQTGTKPKAVKGSMPGLAPSKATVKASEYSRSVKMYWSYRHNPSSADEAQNTIGPSTSFERASAYAGRTRLTKNYRHNPMSNKDALKVIAPGKAYARITDYQGNIKMSKYNDKRFLPDSKFAHGHQNNVKQERTIMTDFKLLWAKMFKKNGTQPNAVKEKSVRPRYDKRERELWPGLYD